MSADVIQFVKNKFVNEFAEAAEACGEFPLRSQFQEILEAILGMTISSSTPLEMKDWLYDLGFALAECRMLSEERERRAQNRVTTFPWQLAKEFLFLCKTRLHLRRTKAKLRDIHAATETRAESSSSSSLPPVKVLLYSPHASYFRKTPKIYGMEEQVRIIERSLLEEEDDDQGIKAIGIVGMGGSGKSALVRAVLNRSAIKEHFNPMIWVGLSEKLNPEDTNSREIIVKQMLKNLIPEYDSPGVLDQLLHDLHNRLSGKKYLIVLDYVCHASDWYFDLRCGLQMGDAGSDNLLSHGLPKGCGGAIIVTSRDEEVASQMVGEHNLHRVLPVLDRESCWSIFMDSISKKGFISSKHYPMLQRIKEEIVDRCDGLPLAAKTLAEIISLQISQHKDWSDSSTTKKIILELDAYDDEDVSRAKTMAETLSGVVAVHENYAGRILVVYGYRHPIEIANELGKFWSTELIYV